MYLSLDWLRDFVEVPKSISADDLGIRLTTHTVEIDGVEKQADRFADVVVGKILEVRPHPNADRLRIARVDAGSGELSIVCGAPNIEAGQLVPVALVGAVLPGNFEIREAEVRGEKSQGMLCAEDELGLGDDHNGIMILGSDAKIGQNFGEYLKMDDVIFEVDNKSITNRPDLWGHFGMAREIAAFLDLSLNDKVYNKKISDLKIEAGEGVKVRVNDTILCPRYMAARIEGVRIESSPQYIQDRLVAVGVRPINNIVDVTNYIMMELGQPMHAFDASKIDEIVVRRANKDEKIETLDGKVRELDEEMLVIADVKKAVAVAGVMGGATSEIDAETGSLILEVANFKDLSIRKTSQKLGLRTDASVRFEKSLDPCLCETALVRAVELIQEICPKAKVVGQITDINSFTDTRGSIDLHLDWLYGYIGHNIGDERVERILHVLGFDVEKGEGVFHVTSPSWRVVKDISIREDLAEEVMRIYGYDKIEPRMPEVEMRIPGQNKARNLEKRIRDILIGVPAATEVSNYSFVGEDQLKKMGIDFSSYVRLVNPIANHHTMLRQSLAPNLLGNVRTNQARYDNFSLFEIGSVCIDIAGGPDKDVVSNEKLPYQERRLGFLAVGTDKDEVFSRAKGVLEHLLEKFGVHFEAQTVEVNPDWAESSFGTRIEVDGKMLGTINVVNQSAAKKAGAKKEVAILEIGLGELLSVLPSQEGFLYRAYGKYPPLVRDLAFVVPEHVLYSDIRKEILNFSSYIYRVDLFDVYQGDNLGKGMKSLAFHVIYQAEKTLTSEEVDDLQSGLLKRMEEKFEAKIRDF